MPKFDPDYVVPTAEVLREWLDERGLNVRVAVACVPKEERQTAANYLQALLNDGPLTEVGAHVLAAVTGVSVAFWVSFEANYRNGLARGLKVSGS